MAMKVSVSTTAMKHRKAYSPQSAGSKIGRPTSKTISRVTERTEDIVALPSDWRKDRKSVV